MKVHKRKCVGNPITSAKTSSQKGVQYLSNAGIYTLRHHNIEISLAQRACPWENGYAERLIRTLKEEEVYLNDYDDITEAKARISHFIEKVYNQKRPHSALGYLTPVKFEQKNLSKLYEISALISDGTSNATPNWLK